MSRLFLVRHSAPLIDPSVPPGEWPLSPEGEEASRQLAQRFHTLPASVCSSPEAKAVQTARLLTQGWGVQVEVEAGLREVEGRAWANSPTEYERAVSRYLRGEVVEGWEERGNAQKRIVAVVEEAMGAQEDLLIVSHGLVLVLLLSWLLEMKPGMLFRVWQGMRFPDLCALDWKTREVVRPFGEPV